MLNWDDPLALSRSSSAPKAPQAGTARFVVEEAPESAQPMDVPEADADWMRPVSEQPGTREASAQVRHGANLCCQLEDGENEVKRREGQRHPPSPFLIVRSPSFLFVRSLASLAIRRR